MEIPPRVQRTTADGKGDRGSSVRPSRDVSCLIGVLADPLSISGDPRRAARSRTISRRESSPASLERSAARRRDRRGARPRVGPARRRHGPVRDPLRPAGRAGRRRWATSSTITATSARAWWRRWTRAIPPPATGRAIRRTCEELADRVAGPVADGEMPLVLGGDHSIAIGTLGGLARALGGPGGVVWLDAHTDINTPSTSPSGNVHGMPLSVALGLTGDQRFEDLPWPVPMARRRPHRAGRHPQRRPAASAASCGASASTSSRSPTSTGWGMQRRDGAGDRARVPVARSCTSRSTWTCSTPTRRPASARRCAAASPTARRTWRWRCWPRAG